MDASLERHIESSLTSALSKGYIQVYYQPVIRSISRKLCSFEALARWIDPEYGFISPGDFIPVLERAGMVHVLDIHIIREVCRRLRHSVDCGEVPIPVSINLSRLDFELCDIYYEVTSAVSEYQIQRDFLYIEITESVMAEEGGSMGSVIERFRAAGFQVWMDDFGSGFSSLNVLKDFEFDEIKLDMNFLTAFNQRSSHIVSSVIHMAKDLGIHTLAEGVETSEQFAYLRDIGCEKIQGYFFGKPQPYEESLAHLASMGIELELPAERSYYDAIGRVDFLSAVPFMDVCDKATLVSARELNSIPLAVVEGRREGFIVLFFNSAFESTASSTSKVAELFSSSQLGKFQPYERLPKRFVNLMEATRSGEMGRMFFISGEQYYEIQAKCVSQMRGAYCVILRLENLSKASESERTDRLDEGLRQIYSLYERVTLVDLESDSILPLYTATRDDVISGRSGLSKLSREYAALLIYPEDREEYLAFADVATLDERVRASGNTGITATLRTRTHHGRYEWFEYNMLNLREHAYLELIRNVHDEVLALIEHGLFVPRGSVGVSAPSTTMDDRVWRALLNSDLINLFWKDADRRFLGASRGFLDYYGFESVDVIRGKNDEDLGWHVQPGAFKSDELQVIEEGVTTRNMPGHCMRNGENRDILASKMPLYDENGAICGLVGHFVDKDLLLANDLRGDETKRRDILTGLLNSRGIHEEARIFRDEYFLRGTDFTCIHVGINEMGSINAQYGFDFGDKAISALGTALKQEFGQAAVVGRYSGHQLAVLCQLHNKDEEVDLRNRAKRAAQAIKQIEGTPVTLYLSVGACRFSEVETLEEQSKRSEMRLLADQDEHTSIANRQMRASEIFHLYDNLPIAYGVFRVLVDEDDRVSDAILFYVNHAFEDRAGLKATELLGKGSREVFPEMTDAWYDIAYRAAFLGEIITDQMYYPPTKQTYFMTASQVIHSGYCCFTYQVLS